MAVRNLIVLICAILACNASYAAARSSAASSTEIVKLTVDEQHRIMVNGAVAPRFPNLKEVFVSMPPPVYDLRLRRSNITGSGIFTLFTDEKGRVTDVKVRKSTGHRELDAQAIYGLRQWRAKPGARREIDVPK